ncbi:hypothetical protein HLB23_02430 [Nocardia uniformis]|uniref:Uncharacterized protein n=1 Tax=Nocardia uniformis TaxID=53432 RepID=A0A849BXA7_9NOCA|nr:hypothetical protein [Nocardia uniformis]NNH68745.1 hypothetical protein [Nocardia uniformis]
MPSQVRGTAVRLNRSRGEPLVAAACGAAVQLVHDVSLPVSAEPVTGPIMTIMFEGQTVPPFYVNSPRRYGEVTEVAADSLE